MCSAYIEDPQELARVSTTTNSSLFPASVSALDSGFGRTANATPESEVLVTVQGEGVQIYNGADSKCIRSWSFPPTTRFACAAQYYRSADGPSFVYAVLHDRESGQGKTVVRWTDKGMDSVGIEDKISAQFEKPINSVVPDASPNGDLLVVHNDGSLTLCRENLEKALVSDAAVANAQLVWSTVIEASQSMRAYLDSRQVAEWVSNESRVFVSIMRTRDPEVSEESTYYASMFVIGESMIEVGTTRIDPVVLSESPVGFAFDADTGILVVLDSTGLLVQFKMSASQSALDDPIVLEIRKAVQLCGFEGGSSGVSVVTVTENYILITGTHRSKPHAGESPYESVVTLWDLQYGCLHAERQLPVSAISGRLQPRLVYQVQRLTPRLADNGHASDQASLAIMVAHTQSPHTALDSNAATKNSKYTSVAWDVSVFMLSAFVPPPTLLASLGLQNNPKYHVTPSQASAGGVHAANALLHEEQEQGMGVLRSGWEAIVDGTAHDGDMESVQAQVSERRQTVQAQENAVLLQLASLGSMASDAYTQRFMEYVGGFQDAPTWLSSHLMTTIMRRCFAEPLAAAQAEHISVFAPKVVRFLLTNCGLANTHAPAPGLIPHLIARVGSGALAEDTAWELTMLALKQCSDIPEDHVADTLYKVLNTHAAHIDNMFNSTALTEAEAEAEADVMRTVARAAKCMIDATMLSRALSRLPVSYIVCIARLLSKWLDAWTAAGLSVEIAASARFVSSSVNQSADESIGARVLRDTIACNSVDGVPSVDSMLTVFKCTPKDTESLLRAHTRDWVPTLELPKILNDAPDVGQTAELMAVVLDSHMTNMMLSPDLHAILQKMRASVRSALGLSESAKALSVSLVPYQIVWEKNLEERIANDAARQRRELGLDEVVLKNGMTRSEAELDRNRPRDSQGVGVQGTYWERVQNLDRYRVEVMHW